MNDLVQIQKSGAPRRILIISPTPTHPTTAGNRVRILALVKALISLGHEVHLAFLRTASGDEEAMRTLLGGRFYPLSYTLPKRSRSLRERIEDAWFGFRDPTYRHTLRIDDWFNPWALSRISDLHTQHHFDAVMVEYVFFSRALECFGPDVLKIVDTHDVFTDRHQLFLREGRQPEWFSTTRREEARGLRRADVVVAIQDMERAFFSEISGRKTVTVGHLVPLRPSHRGRSPGSCMLFVASLNPVNNDALDFLLAEILPLVRARLPEARLLLAGRICEVVADQPGVEKLGVLPDLALAYAQADVVVVPMRFGTGLNIKSIEALAHGMPLVATSNGSKGIEATPPIFLTGDTPEAFADAVVRICNDAELAARLSHDASVFAESWNARHVAALDAIIRGTE